MRQSIMDAGADEGEANELLRQFSGLVFGSKWHNNAIRRTIVFP
jgi:hypothetical protein